MKTERYEAGDPIKISGALGRVLVDDGGTLVRVELRTDTGGYWREAFPRGVVERATEAEMVDARELSTIARPLAGIPIIDHRADGARLPIPTEPDPIVKVWTRLDPRTRRRIERASRALVVALDRHVEKELEK